MNIKNAVIEQLGYSEDDLDETSCCYEELLTTCQDISNHGIDGGFGQFVYYKDTVKFFDDNKTDILAMLNELADDLGEDAFTLVANFGCLKCHELTATDIAEAIYTHTGGLECQVKNALAWFAAEEVARQIADEVTA